MKTTLHAGKRRPRRAKKTPTETPGSPEPRYWEKPRERVSAQEEWVEPDPEVRGMLWADRIQFYAERVHLIEPFKLANLKPASYSLTLGPNYQLDGFDHVLTEDNPILEIPQNSIVFASMGEQLRLPHY